MWSKIIKACTKYGTKVLKWAARNKQKLLSLGYAVFSYIFSIWG